MPEGPGHYFGRLTAGRLWGQPFLIAFLMELSKAWVQKHPQHPFGIGDIAREDGASMPDHKSHDYGSAVDIFVIHKLGIKRNDKSNVVTYVHPGYDLARTSDLARQIASLSNTFQLQQFLYNDPKVQKLKATWPPIKTYVGHDEHIHLNFTGKHSYSKAKMNETFR